MRTSLTGVNNSIIIKAGLDRIRSGDIISLKILENKNGLIKASVKGKIISFKALEGMMPGDLVKVKAQWSGKVLYLQRIENKQLQNFIRENGLSSDPATITILETARRAGLPLKTDNLRLLKKFIRKSGKGNRESIRLAVEAVKKGLSPVNLLNILQFSGDSDNENEQNKAVLFNQLNSGNELWFVFPYKFKIESSILEGSIRIRKNLLIKKIDSVVIETSMDIGKIYFLIKNYGTENSEMQILTEKKLRPFMRRKIKTGMNEIQCNLSLKIDDNIIEECFGDENGLNFDGFTLDYTDRKGFEAVV